MEERDEMFQRYLALFCNYHRSVEEQEELSVLEQKLMCEQCGLLGISAEQEKLLIDELLAASRKERMRSDTGFIPQVDIQCCDCGDY